MCKMLFRIIFALVILQKSWANIENVDIARVDNDQKGHILFFHPAGTRSHLIAMNGFAEGLVENGYRVTSAIYAESKIIHDNYKEILIEDK